MLAGSHDGRVDHRVFVGEIVRQGLEKILAAQREKRLWVLHQPPKRSGKSRHGPHTELPEHRIDEKTIAQLAVATECAGGPLPLICESQRSIFNPADVEANFAQIVTTQ